MKTVMLREVADITAGQGAPQKEEHFNSSGVPFVRAGSLEGLINGESEGSLERITIEAAQDHRLKLFPKDTVLFAKSGMSATKDRVYKLQSPAHVVSHLAAIMPHKDLDADYLMYFLRFFRTSRLIKDPSYPSIGLSDVEKIKINKLELAQQIRAAQVLRKSEGIVERRREALRLADELLKSTFWDMFGDPVRNSKKWGMRRLKEISRKVTDGEHLNPIFTVEGKNIVMAKDVRDDGVDFSQEKFVSELDYKKFVRKCNPERNDLLLVSRGATVGRCTVINTNIPFCLMGSVILIKPGDALNSRYLQFLFKDNNFVKKVIGVSSASAQQAIYLSHLKELSIPLPDIDIQNKFSDFVQKVDGLKAKQKQSEAELQNLFNALMQQSFKGE